jgi:hypothetical protein
LPEAWNDAQNRLREATRQPATGWQQELEAVFSGKANPATPPLVPGFPIGEIQPRPELPQPPHTAGRIEAQPAPSSPEGSFRRW